MGRADVAALKKGRRSGREGGIHIYIAAEQLEAMGIDPKGPVPLYRIWEAKGRPRAVVSLYPQHDDVHAIQEEASDGDGTPPTAAS